MCFLWGWKIISGLQQFSRICQQLNVREIKSCFVAQSVDNETLHLNEVKHFNTFLLVFCECFILNVLNYLSLKY